MRWRLPMFVLVPVSIIGLAGCVSTSAGPAGQAPPPPPGDLASALSAPERDSARKLYIAKCARCHKFYAPDHYSERDWRGWMDKMSRKAKLKPEQKELLLQFLDLYRTNAPAS